jgi:hypothetical protein
MSVSSSSVGRVIDNDIRLCCSYVLGCDVLPDRPLEPDRSAMPDWWLMRSGLPVIKKSAPKAHTGNKRNPISARDGSGTAACPKIWYHDHTAWPALQAPAPTAISNRHRRSTPLDRRPVHQHTEVATSQATS